MQRTGRTNMPTFRIVVTEHTRGPKSANFVEKVGSYNPKTKERSLNAERVKYWLSVGAKATGTMHNMLVSAGIVEGKKVNVLPRKSPPKKEGEGETAAVAATAPVVAEVKPEAETNDQGGGEAGGDAGTSGGGDSSAA